MRSFLKFFIQALTMLVIFVGLFLGLNFKSDISVSELKENYTFPESQYINIQGMPVHYRVKGEGEPIVLVHGTGGSLHDWKHWTDLLSGDYKMISLDLPAFGLTGPNPKNDYSIDMYLSVLEEFLTKIDVDTFYMAGNSFGGFLSWNYAAKHPNQVKKLVLVNASGYPSHKHSHSPNAFTLSNYPIAAKLMTSITPKFIIKKTAKDVYENDALVTDEVVHRYYDLLLRTGNRKAILSKMQQTKPADTTLIQTLSMPTLVMWGKKDKLIGVENAYNFKRDIPHAKILIYDNVGHVPMEEIPEDSARDLEAFLLGSHENSYIP